MRRQRGTIMVVWFITFVKLIIVISRTCAESQYTKELKSCAGKRRFPIYWMRFRSLWNLCTELVYKISLVIFENERFPTLEPHNILPRSDLLYIFLWFYLLHMLSDVNQFDQTYTQICLLQIRANRGFKRLKFVPGFPIPERHRAIINFITEKDGTGIIIKVSCWHNTTTESLFCP